MKSFDRFAVVCSTAGSVLESVLEKDENFRQRLRLVVTDRPCGAENVSGRFGVPHVRIEEASGVFFSERLKNILIENAIDAVFLFFSRILSGPVLELFSGRLINFHPSLLPAFPGLHGFEDGWVSTSLLLGSTVHFVDSGIDTGPIIQQAFLPINRAVDSMSEIRHRIFIQQCASLSQVSEWISKRRVLIGGEGKVVIEGANYHDMNGFIPALENNVARNIISAQSYL